MHMPWGKHAGWDIEALPLDYIRWLLRQPWLSDQWPSLDHALRAEAARRMDSHAARHDPHAAHVQTITEIVDVGYKTLARRYHPDVGGTTEDMQRLNQAMAWLRTALRSLNAG